MGMSSSARVAVIDDDEHLRRAFARLLRAARMLPTTYPSAEAFVADPKYSGFDCLVLDVQLPGMSGLELQKRLQVERVVTPILFITAHDDPKVRKQARAAGCASYFRKSDSGSEVLEAIRRAVARPPAVP